MSAATSAWKGWSFAIGRPGHRRRSRQLRCSSSSGRPRAPRGCRPRSSRDDHGFILTGVQRPDPSDGLGLATTLPGVFAAGDVRSNPVKRVAAAVGDGSTAIRQVHEARLQRRRAAALV